MTTMLAPNESVRELALPAVDVRALLRRVALAAVLAAGTLAVVLLAGGRMHALADAIHRGLSANPAWAAVGGGFEFVSLAGYVGLLSLVAGRAAPRVGPRESAQITLAGAAATRLLPTAGAGGVVLALWALRRAGLGSRAATHTLLVFMIVLYSVFLASIAVSGGVLALGIVHASGPTELAAVPALAATLAIGLCLGLAARHALQAKPRGDHAGTCDRDSSGPGPRGSRARTSASLLGEATAQACRLIRQRDARLAGALAYWAFDAAVLWAMLHAFGSPPLLPVLALAYFIGQLANTLPIPGSVSGGIAGVLIAFGVPAEVALPSVLTYRAVAVWLPAPVAIAAVPALRATLARWRREDGLVPAGEPWRATTRGVQPVA
jgi:uncharacterized membrane protein YbhN (UPF0104 family)